MSLKEPVPIPYPFERNKNMKYKNIILDIGGVLLSYRWLDFIRETVPDEKEAKAFARILFDDPLWLDFDIETRPFDDVVEDYITKYPEHEADFRYAFTHLERMPVARPKVWEKLPALKKAGYRIYLLSNYSSRMYHTHTDGLPFFEYIDGKVISYEVHHLKPYREIYDSLFQKYDLDPSECIFFDDRQLNVDGGRKCGMEGRVVYSEDVLIGYFDRLLSPDFISNPFHDPSKQRDERISWLLSNMNMDEKILLLSDPAQGVGRFGVEGFVPGGEASHGVEARNTQNGIIDPDTTTSFPNPVGMSSSWDPDMLFKAGRVVGEESRASWKKHRKTGLSRWAPTVDMERDPRWGRNEEGYGEDPLLTSINASAYIKGMQGASPEGETGEYVLCGSTLKHFYANNLEFDRFFCNSSVGMRDKYEYYLPAFLYILQNARPLGVMTSYNRINGIPGMLNPEVNSLLKGRYGLMHAVCDAFSVPRLVNFHHYHGTLAESLAFALKAGVDHMSDMPDVTEKAVRSALELNLISEEDLDRALRNYLKVGMTLGIYDPDDACPFNSITAEDCDSEKNRKTCLKLTEKSLVLLENKNDCLPLEIRDAADIAVVGPLADKWYMDWYGGIPPFKRTVMDALNEIPGIDNSFSEGLDRYRIMAGDKAWHISEDSTITLCDPDEGDLFYIEDWGDGVCTIRCAASGKYVQRVLDDTDENVDGLIKADRDDIFNWHVTCRFHLIENGDGTFTLKDRFDQGICITNGNILRSSPDKSPSSFSLVKVSDGVKEAEDFVDSKGTVVLVLGCNPMIPAREDFDRVSISLPSCQQRLLDAFAESNKKVIVVLISNYPYTFNGMENKVDAMLLSATGSEYMGDAIVSALFGKSSPAGRLVQSWPVGEDVLPDINDYRIIGNRTYRYISENLLYPFGYGLSYGRFEYRNLTVLEDPADQTRLTITLEIENTGKHTSDEVVQIYAGAGFSDRRLSPAGYGRRLIAFTRVKDMAPGESRAVTLSADKAALMVYDVVRQDHILYPGTYHIYAGFGPIEELLAVDLTLSGEGFKDRDISLLTPVYACDESCGIEFTEGAFGMTAATPLSEKDTGSLIYSQCVMPEKPCSLKLILRSRQKGDVKVFWNDNLLASWSGNTSSPQKEMDILDMPSEMVVPPASWEPLWTEIELTPDITSSDRTGILRIEIAGDVELLSYKLI